MISGKLIKEDKSSYITNEEQPQLHSKYCEQYRPFVYGKSLEDYERSRRRSKRNRSKISEERIKNPNKNRIPTETRMSICRACLCTLDKPMDAINLFDHLYKNNNLSILLVHLFNIKIDTNDEITKEICQECANKIVEFNEFYLMLLESDRKLRSLNETDCKPFLDAFEFETGNVLPHEVVTVVKDELYVEPFKCDTDDNSREIPNSAATSQRHAINESSDVKCEKEKKRKRIVSMWECFACHRTYKSIKTVRKHSKTCLLLKSQSEERTKGKYYKKIANNEFVCDFCPEKIFTSRQSVYAHIQKHRSQKYLCNICGKCLSDRNNLTKHHKTVHLKEKNYQCSTCEKRYDSSYRLRIHENSHKGIRLFGCPLCSQRFITTSALSRHKKTVHKQGELYECNVCFRKFNVAYNMRAHMVTHTGIRPHNCQYCKADFQRKHKLVTHVKEVHGLEIT